MEPHTVQYTVYDAVTVLTQCLKVLANQK